MIICHPDKVRFRDASPDAGPHLVHTVDLSDERCKGNFITFWCRGITNGETFRKKHGLDSHHNRELYHRDPPWLPDWVGQARAGGFAQHYHLDLASPPQWNDLQPFLPDLPEAIQRDLREFLCGGMSDEEGPRLPQAL